MAADAYRNEIAAEELQAGAAATEYALALAVTAGLAAAMSRLLKAWIFSLYESAAATVVTGWFGF